MLEPFHFDTPLFENELFINSHYNSGTGVLDRPAFKVPLSAHGFTSDGWATVSQNSANSFEIGYEADGKRMPGEADLHGGK